MCTETFSPRYLDQPLESATNFASSAPWAAAPWTQTYENRTASLATAAVAPPTYEIVYGSLTDYDAENGLRRGAYMDNYSFTSDYTGKTRFNLSSNDFDTYLQILDFNTGEVIASNDDASNSTNSEITLNLTQGKQLILRVTSYYAQDNGCYQLEVETTINLTKPNPSPPPSGNLPFSSVYGYGLIDAAAAVARAIDQRPFSPITNLGGDNWHNDLVNAPEVWAKGYTGKGVVVAVVDSGVDYTHPDLDQNIWRNAGEIAGNGIDDDLNGYIDDILVGILLITMLIQLPV